MRRGRTLEEKRSFGRRFRTIFEELGLSTETFLDAAWTEDNESGIHPNTLTRWKRGESFPKPHHLDAIFRALVENGWNGRERLKDLVLQMIDYATSDEDWEYLFRRCKPSAKNKGAETIHIYLSHKVGPDEQTELKKIQEQIRKFELTEKLLDKMGVPEQFHDRASSYLFNFETEDLASAIRTGPVDISFGISE